MVNNSQKSAPLVSPPIVTPKIDFKGSIYHFALAKNTINMQKIKIDLSIDGQVHEQFSSNG